MCCTGELVSVAECLVSVLLCAINDSHRDSKSEVLGRQVISDACECTRSWEVLSCMYVCMYACMYVVGQTHAVHDFQRDSKPTVFPAIFLVRYMAGILINGR
jgi:hypothetical protein